MLLARNLFGLGCNAHILHNCAKHSFDLLPLDAEVIISKIFGFFYGYTVRTERLKEFCSFVEQEYLSILGHFHVRWLSLEPAVERILKMYRPLQSFFLSEPNCPNVIKHFFEKNESELWLTFIHAQSSFFSNTIKKIEASDLSALEVCNILNEFMAKLDERNKECFIPGLTRTLFKKMQENGDLSMSDAEFKARIANFYNAAWNYLNAWFNSNNDFTLCVCFLLNNIPTRKDIDDALQKLIKECDLLVLDFDEIFDEFTCIKNYLESQATDFFREKPATKWAKIFTHFKKENVTHTNFRKIISLLFCLPGTNAFTERVFSIINNYWSNEKGNLSLKTLEASINLKVNFDISCEAFSNKLEQNQDILKKIHNAEKYL